MLPLVDHAVADLFFHAGEHGRQAAQTIAEIHIAPHRVRGRELGQAIENGGVSHVARVQNALATGESLEHGRAQQTVGVGNDAQSNHGRILYRFIGRALTHAVVVQDPVTMLKSRCFLEAPTDCLFPDRDRPFSSHGRPDDIDS